MKIDRSIVERLYKKAKIAYNNAYAPFSNFKVGAALMTQDGKIYSGCNVENSSYGLTMCAERVAIFKAISEGKREFKYLLILCNNLGPGCGACRQVMCEFFDDNMVIIGADLEKNIKFFNLKDILPYAFKLKGSEK